MLKKTEREVLRGLMAGPKHSDREVAGGAHVSQPTVSRTRSRLEEVGIIQSYEVIPDLAKLGFEIVAFSVVKLVDGLEKHGQVIYAVEAEKMVILSKETGNVLVMSVHQSYSDYFNFLRMYQGQPIFVTITSEKPIKPLSFKDIPF